MVHSIFIVVLLFFYFLYFSAEENVNYLEGIISSTISQEQKQTIGIAMKMESNSNATENIIGL